MKPADKLYGFHNQTQQEHDNALRNFRCVSFASAMPANKNAVVKTDSGDVIEIFAGCGKNYKPNRQTHKCEPY